MDPQQLLWLLGPPLGAAAVLLVLLPLVRLGRFAGAIALGVGYCAGHLIASGLLTLRPEAFSLSLPAFPPLDRVQVIGFAAVLGLGLGIAERFVRPRLAQWLLRFLALRAYLWFLLQPMVEHHWAAHEATLWMWGAELGLLLIWWALERGAASERLYLLPAGLAAAGVGLTLMLGWGALVGKPLGFGSATLGQMALVLGGLLGLVAAVLRFRPGLVPLQSALPVVVMAFGGLLLASHFYAEAPLFPLLLLAAAAPALIAVGPLARRTPARVQPLVGLLPAVLLVAGALGSVHFEYSPFAAERAASPVEDRDPEFYGGQDEDYGHYGDYGEYGGYDDEDYGVGEDPGYGGYPAPSEGDPNAEGEGTGEPSPEEPASD